MNTKLSEQEILRRESLEALRKEGINPYPAEEVPVNVLSETIKQEFPIKPEKYTSVCVAGRVMTKRIMGKASFLSIKDSSGRIQAYINRDVVCPGEDKTLYNVVFKKQLDIGDFVSLKGHVFTTKTEEISIHVSELKLLSKALKPLPVVKTDSQGEKHDEFNDPELRYRQRYVDLIVNEGVKEVFVKRTQVFNTMREVFNEKGYLEVETPILQSIPGGAAARPFMTHHNTLDMPLYLRISNELYLKRLIVGGFDGVYEFAKDFRNEGMDRTHNPEFTILEIYVAYKDYKWMMEFTESMFEKIARKTTGSAEVSFDGKKINLAAPYQRVPILEAIKTHTGFDLIDKNEAEIKKIAESLDVETSPDMGKGKVIDAIFGDKCEKYYVQPTFITDYPIEMSPLCKKHRDDERLTERFELFINGTEIANAYSELNDPIDQKERFEDQLGLQEKGDDEAMFIDKDFLRSLEYGMPPTSGMGIGMDRLVMLLTGKTSIQEVIFFPQMRPEKNE
ncbi:MAG: lysine--tRNA ligase [Schleiferiaceae bacterium]|jgi:lysyl-tRNA synthetase class 2|nr:MAG: lysine--tRNA ligase [Owenweeksia sp. TMED14]|tara:strand:- start:12880 stop:14397 length:1518 start_codon:yes stop_codon:yes gene_type:complete